MAMHKYFAILLSLVAFHDFISAHGRKIKPLNQHSSLKNSAGHKDSPQYHSMSPLKTNINVPTPSVADNKLKHDLPTMPKYDIADVGSGDSGANYANAFRPTTPGNSPGVGHRKFEGEDKHIKVMVEVQSPDVKLSVAEGLKNDFRPTDPASHNPGIGIVHPRENKKGQLN